MFVRPKRSEWVTSEKGSSWISGETFPGNIPWTLMSSSKNSGQISCHPLPLFFLFFLHLGLFLVTFPADVKNSCSSSSLTHRWLLHRASVAVLREPEDQWRRVGRRRSLWAAALHSCAVRPGFVSLAGASNPAVRISPDKMFGQASEAPVLRHVTPTHKLPPGLPPHFSTLPHTHPPPPLPHMWYDPCTWGSHPWLS